MTTSRAAANEALEILEERKIPDPQITALIAIGRALLALDQTLREQNEILRSLDLS